MFHLFLHIPSCKQLDWIMLSQSEKLLSLPRAYIFSCCWWHTKTLLSDCSFWWFCNLPDLSEVGKKFYHLVITVLLSNDKQSWKQCDVFPHEAIVKGISLTEMNCVWCQIIQMAARFSSFQLVGRTAILRQAYMDTNPVGLSSSRKLWGKFGPCFSWNLKWNVGLGCNELPSRELA